jgi:hypothetical protein
MLLDKMSNIMQDNKPKLYNPSKNLLLLIQDRKIRSSESQSRRSKENFDENYCRKLGYSEETSK